MSLLSHHFPLCLPLPTLLKVLGETMYLPWTPVQTAAPACFPVFSE